MTTDIIELDEYRPRIFMWIVCLGCKEDYFTVLPWPHDEIECKCGSDNVRGIHVTGNNVVTYRLKEKALDKRSRTIKNWTVIDWFIFAGLVTIMIAAMYGLLM